MSIIFAFPTRPFPFPFPFLLPSFPMSKKMFLDVEFDFEFKLWGIATTLRDFQVGLVLNRMLGTNFRRVNDLEFNNPDAGKLSYYSIFRYEDEMDKGLFHLIGNKNQGDFLIPEVKQADYFLRFEGTPPESYFHELYEKLRSIKHFIAVMPLQPDKLKSKMNLVVE